MGFCRRERSWAGSSARTEALATSTSRYSTTLQCPCPCPSLGLCQAHGAEHKGRSLGHCAWLWSHSPAASQILSLSYPTGNPNIPLQPPLCSLWPWGTQESLSLLSLPQGCFSTFGRTLQRYISLPGICSLAVLGIEVRRGARARAGRVPTLCGRGVAQWARRARRSSGLSQGTEPTLHCRWGR